jgi:hypothetical protein
MSKYPSLSKSSHRILNVGSRVGKTLFSVDGTATALESLECELSRDRVGPPRQPQTKETLELSRPRLERLPEDSDFIRYRDLAEVNPLRKLNEALRKCLDGLTAAPEPDSFLGHVMATMTRQLGAVTATLRIRDFEQNTLPLELVFQDGRAMAPIEAKYPED